jgi:hypothetical protein
LTAKFQSDLAPLLAVATDRERIAIEAVIANGSGPAAQAAAGLTKEQLHSRIRTARRRLQREGLGSAAPPEGFVPTAIATDAEGRVRSVRSRAEGAEEHADAIPQGHRIKGVSTYYDGAGEIRGQWIKTDQAKAEAEAAFWEAAKSHAKEWAGVSTPRPAPAEVVQDLMTIYAIGDAHCGMLAWGAEAGRDFDLKIWRSQLERALDLLMLQSPPTANATILNVGDWYHVQSSDFRTPAGGNKLDGDSRLGKIARVGFDCMRWAIDRALQKHATVTVRNVRGNHDTDLSVIFNMWLQSTYENDPRVIIPDNFAYVAYERFGSTLLGFTHGDGCAIAELPGVMSTHPDWSATSLHMWLTGHVHHKRQLKLQEYRNCVVESFSTMAPKDAWHAWKQYQSAQGIEALIFHRKHGLKGRSYVSISEVESEL